MKKLLVLLLTVISTTTMWAQTTPTEEAAPVNPKVLKIKLDKARAATEHPKKGTKANTWMKYALALNDAYYAYTRQLYVGQEAAKVVEALKEPTNATAIPIETVGGRQYKIYKYPNVDVYMDMDDKVAMFFDKSPIYPDALNEYERVLLKALSLDKKLAEKVVPQLKVVINAYLIHMQNHLAFKEHAKAIEYAVKAAELQKNPDVKDEKYLESYYYASVCAMQGELFSEAKKYLDILVANNELKDGEVLYYLAYSEDRLGNTDKAKKLYEEGVAKFPTNQDIMKSLIDIYIRTKEDPSKIIPYIKQAQEGDPKNVALYIAEGVAYEKMGQINKSIEAYKIAIDLDPKSFIAYYNLGYSYSILADGIAGEINALVGKKNTTVDLEAKYKKLNEIKKQALPFLVKAHELNKEDINTITLLRSIYFSLREESSSMMSNFEKFDALYKNKK